MSILEPSEELNLSVSCGQTRSIQHSSNEAVKVGKATDRVLQGLLKNYVRKMHRPSFFINDSVLHSRACPMDAAAKRNNGSVPRCQRGELDRRLGERQRWNLCTHDGRRQVVA